MLEPAGQRFRKMGAVGRPPPCRRGICPSAPPGASDPFVISFPGLPPFIPRQPLIFPFFLSFVGFVSYFIHVRNPKIHFYYFCFNWSTILKRNLNKKMTSFILTHVTILVLFIFCWSRFSSAWKASFNIFYSSGLLVINYFRFCMPKEVFILRLFWKRFLLRVEI